MIWFTSDTHFAHSNICYATSKWPDKDTKTRRFNSIQEMNRKMIENINKYVQQDDTLYFLGDWCMGGIQNYYNFWKQLNCKDIRFIPGNHDHHFKKNKEIPNLYYEYGCNFSETPPIHDHCRKAYVQDLFFVLPELFTVELEGQKFVLSHYPIEEWEDMGKGAIHLHGHCHGQINSCETNKKYKRMDIGLDWKEFRPYSLDEILKIMEKREIKKHHY